jgi:hypothetical protein
MSCLGSRKMDGINMHQYQIVKALLGIIDGINYVRKKGCNLFLE